MRRSPCAVDVCAWEQSKVRTIIDFALDLGDPDRTLFCLYFSLSHVTGHAGTRREAVYVHTYISATKQKPNKECARTDHQHLAHCFALFPDWILKTRIYT